MMPSPRMIFHDIFFFAAAAARRHVISLITLMAPIFAFSSDFSS